MFKFRFFLKLFIPAIIAWIFLVYIISFFIDFSGGINSTTFGVTFSQPYAEHLGLDWKKTYLAILDELKVKDLRLIAYWNQIENKEGEFNFTDLDWQIEQARERRVEIILAIGRRLPHWPECHVPKWAENLSEQEIQKRIIFMLEKVIKHYQDLPNIKMWQVDNEPLLTLFGECPKPDKRFIKKEITLIKSLDKRPIIITDSGELSFWFRTAHLADYLGTTAYRVVWNKYLGYWKYNYLIPPAFYYFKATLNRKPTSEIIISELQAEPWTPKGILNTSLTEQKQSMDLEQFQSNINFARRTAFSEAYLWGAEYWYWLKEKGDDSLWQTAKALW